MKYDLINAPLDDLSLHEKKQRMLYPAPVTAASPS